MYDTPNLLMLVLQTVHLAVVMPPWVSISIHIDHQFHSYDLSLSTIVTIVIFLRVYHVLYFLYSQSQYHSQRAQFFT